MGSVVYFMQADAYGGRVKIGTSDNVEARKTALERQLKCRLRLFATLPGGHEQEGLFHQTFRKFRDTTGIPEAATREWFRPERSLLRFVSDLQEDPRLWGLLKDPRTIGSRTVLDVHYIPDDPAVRMWSCGSYRPRFFVEGKKLPAGTLYLRCNGWGRLFVRLDVDRGYAYGTNTCLKFDQVQLFRINDEATTTLECEWFWQPFNVLEWGREEDGFEDLRTAWTYEHKAIFRAIQPHEPLRSLLDKRPCAEDDPDVRGAAGEDDPAAGETE